MVSCTQLGPETKPPLRITPSDPLVEYVPLYALEI